MKAKYELVRNPVLFNKDSESFPKFSSADGYFYNNEIMEFLRVLKTNYFQFIWFRLLYSFGMTIEELVNLKVEDIDIENRLIRIITSRNCNPRILRMPQSIVHDLRSETCQRVGSEFLFTGRNGKLSKRTVQKLFEKLESATGRKVTISKLRRTTAVYLSRKGWSDKMIGYYLGHLNIRSTRQMLKASQDIIPDKVFPLDEFTEPAA